MDAVIKVADGADADDDVDTAADTDAESDADAESDEGVKERATGLDSDDAASP
jgi:hypothetical protein